MRIAITLLAVAVLWGCATRLTEEEAAKCEGDEQCLAKALEYKKEELRYEIEERDIEFQERYVEFSARCKAQGGTVWLVRRVSNSCRFGSRYCPPSVGDSYSCGAPLIVR